MNIDYDILILNTIDEPRIILHEETLITQRKSSEKKTRKKKDARKRNQ